MTNAQWCAKEIGPRRVGGRYMDSYWHQEYEVVSIEHNVPVWGWLMTVRWVDGQITRHCTAWGKRDRVLSQPA